MVFSQAVMLARKLAALPIREYRKLRSRDPRAALLATVAASDFALEIGPFVRPVLRGPNVRYFDVLTKEEMIDRAAVFGDTAEMAVDIDFVSRTGELSIIADASFDIVLSSHCIEHQPDLIFHLQQVSRILKPGGRYLLIIPDKRYCFDHFIPETTFEEVSQAHSEKRRTHVLQSVIEHRAHVTHNNAARHWAGDHGEPAYISDPSRVTTAIDEFEAAAGGYIDVHAWQFTPDSFVNVVSKMSVSDMTVFLVKSITETRFGALEFYAVLKRAD